MLDLHGNTKKKETAPGGGNDENVFDIEQGVAIGLFVKDALKSGSRASRMAAAEVLHHDLWGARADKYAKLMIESEGSVKWAKVEPRPTFFLLKLLEGDVGEEYDEWTSVNQIFPVNSVGIQTARDALTVRWSNREIWGVVREMVEGGGGGTAQKVPTWEGRAGLEGRVGATGSAGVRPVPGQGHTNPLPTLRPRATRTTRGSHAVSCPIHGPT